MPRSKRVANTKTPATDAGPEPASSAGTRFVHIVIVLPTEFSYAREVLRGIIAATRERNLLSSTSAAGDGSSTDRRPWLFRLYRGTYQHSGRQLKAWIEDWQAEGIIYHAYDNRVRKICAESGKPVVEVFSSGSTAASHQILPDDTAAGAMAAQHFLERGFRNFGFFGNTPDRWVNERRLGFQAEIEKALGPTGTPWTYSDWDQFASPSNASKAQDGNGDRRDRRSSSAMGAWLASLPRPCAVLAANDLWGFELVQAAREVGLQVPDDVAVLGVDNDELLCEIAHPPLSSIRLGAEQMGHRAVALLEQLLRGEPPKAPIPNVPPLSVVGRQSTDVLAVEDPDIAEAVALIRKRACHGLTVSDLLRQLPVNRRTLERRFVSILGHTPLAEIQRVRLERAKSLLMTDLPIYAIASQCGFGTPEYMATLFAETVGISPTAYRRTYAPSSKWQHLPPA